MLLFSFFLKEADATLVFDLTPEISYCGHNLLLRNIKTQV